MYLSVHMSIAGDSMLQLLQHNDASPFTNDKAIPVSVKWAGRELWSIVELCRQSLHTAKPANRHSINAGLCSPTDHDISVAIAYHAEGISNTVSAGGACCADSVVGTLEAVMDANGTSSHVDKSLRHKERIHSAKLALHAHAFVQSILLRFKVKPDYSLANVS